MRSVHDEPQLVAIYFSGFALVLELITLSALLLGKSKALTKAFNLPRFHLGFDNRLLQCLIGQILCVEMFHVFNIWEYTSTLADQDRCQYSAKMVVFFYVFQCFFLYLFLMVKVKATFIGQTKFTTYLDLFLRLLTFGVIPSLMILVFFLFNGQFIVNPGGTNICVMFASPYWIMVLVFLDIVLNAGFLLLFILPIKQLVDAADHMSKGGSKTNDEISRRRELMGVAKRNLIATSVCVVISIGALGAMIWEAYADDVMGKVFGCFPCVVASISNTFLMLITTKGAWKREAGSDVSGRGDLKKQKSGKNSTALQVSAQVAGPSQQGTHKSEASELVGTRTEVTAEAQI